jgi:Zn-dependent protease with chaperone function
MVEKKTLFDKTFYYICGFHWNREKYIKKLVLLYYISIFHLFTLFFLSLISILIYILFFIQIFLILFNISYKFSFVNLIDFCCSFLLLGVPIFMPLFLSLFSFSFFKEKLNYQHSFVYKNSKHNCNRISGCSYILEHLFTFVSVIVKFLKKIVYEKEVQLLKDKSLP